jgi:hypothetical protein
MHVVHQFMLCSFLRHTIDVLMDCAQSVMISFAMMLGAITLHGIMFPLSPGALLLLLLLLHSLLFVVS